ncbi:hypothetical protein P4S72_07380 [Vibrio sp. PP-XX7]
MDLDKPAKPVWKPPSPANWTAFGHAPNGQNYVADYAGGGIYQINAQP